MERAIGNHICGRRMSAESRMTRVAATKSLHARNARLCARTTAQTESCVTSSTTHRNSDNATSMMKGYSFLSSADVLGGSGTSLPFTTFVMTSSFVYFSAAAMHARMMSSYSCKHYVQQVRSVKAYSAQARAHSRTAARPGDKFAPERSAVFSTDTERCHIVASTECSRCARFISSTFSLTCRVHASTATATKPAKQ